MIPLVAYVFRRFYAWSFYNRRHRKDILQAGVVGWLEAKKRFDPALGIDFQHFAMRQIQWAMKAEIGLTHGGTRPTCAGAAPNPNSSTRITGRRKVLQSSVSLETIAPMLTSAPSAEEQLIEAERSAILNSAVAGLEPTDRAVILGLLNAQSGQDVAQQLGISKQAVNARKHKIITHLQRHLEVA
jgi:RNA polymerase sigma factor (sigma-70 family)